MHPTAKAAMSATRSVAKKRVRSRARWYNRILSAAVVVFQTNQRLAFVGDEGQFAVGNADAVDEIILAVASELGEQHFIQLR